MARVEAITSEDLVYQVTLVGGSTVRGRNTTPVWTGIVPPRRFGDPPTPFQPRGIEKAEALRGPEFISPDIQFTARSGDLNYGYGLICYDFRTNNTERLDTSGRPEQRMKDVKRIQSAELKFQVSAIAGRVSAFYIACLPKINISRSMPDATELGMGYFLGYNELYRGPLGRPVGTERDGSGNINPACIAGAGVDRSGIPTPIVLRDSDSYPATITVKLRPRMLRTLELAMKNGNIIGFAAVPIHGFGEGPQMLTANYGRDFWNGTTALRSDITNGIKIRSGLNASYDPPKLTYRYALDNNKINQGAGISRTSTSGFMTDNVFAGTNSGFSS